MNPHSRTILLFHDAPDEADLTTLPFVLAFRRAGFGNPIHVVRSPNEAIQYFKKQGRYINRAEFPLPSLLLIDLAVPGATGGEVLAWVRQQPQLRLLPVIVFSDSLSPSGEQTALDLGANACEVKPASFEQFVRLMKKIAEFWLLSGGLPHPEAVTV